MWQKITTWIQSGTGVTATIGAGVALVIWFWKLIAGALVRVVTVARFFANIDRKHEEISGRLDGIDRGQVHMIEWRKFLLDRETGAAFFGCGPNGECQWVSEHWTRLTGISSADAIGNGWEMGIAKEDRERVVRAWKDAVDRRRPFEEMFSYLDRDGVKSPPMKVFAKPIVDSSGIIGWAGRASK